MTLRGLSGFSSNTTLSAILIIIGIANFLLKLGYNVRMESEFSKRFIKNEGKKPFIADSVIKKSPLGEGWSGEVYEVEVKKGTHSKSFAIKDFLKNGKKGAEILANKEYNSYLELKKADIKVFPTLRISKNHRELLTTLGTNENFFVVASRSKIEWNKVHKISNIESLISSIKENILKAAESNIELPSDSYFFIIKKSDPTMADFLIGDLGGVKIYNESKKEGLLRKNVAAATDALEYFIELYVDTDHKKEYEDIVEKNLNNINDPIV